jgi:uncharacterized phage protein (TIGR01671 family)
MREILFKAKRIDNGKWAEGCLVIDHSRSSLFEYRMRPVESGALYAPPINPETICQFTGLCDKNGNKIWENDIVLITENVYSTVKFGLYHEAGKSERTHQGFYLESMDKYYYREELGYWAKESVVVGNIFDNKELLQEGSDE